MKLSKSLIGATIVAMTLPQLGTAEILCTYGYSAPKDLKCESLGTYAIAFADVDGAQKTLSALARDKDCKIISEPVMVTDIKEFSFKCVDAHSNKLVRVQLENLSSHSVVILETPGVLPSQSNFEVLNQVLIRNPNRPVRIDNTENGYMDTLFPE